MAGYSQHLEPLLECSTLFEAELVRGLLEARGFHAVVQSGGFIGRTTLLGVRSLIAIRVAVPAEELNQAMHALKEAEAQAPMLAETPAARPPYCPQCGSENVERDGVSSAFVASLGAAALVLLYLLLRALSIYNLLLFVILLIFAASVLLGAEGWRCNACRHRWREAV